MRGVNAILSDCHPALAKRVSGPYVPRTESSHLRIERRSRQGFALRDDIAGFALRDDIAGFALRDDMV